METEKKMTYIHEEREPEKEKILIVSYSYSGNTHRIAREIQKLSDGDLCEIYPWQPYPMSFPELLAQVRQEVRSNYRPRLLPQPYFPKEYGVIFVGSPNWCGTIAPPLASWLYHNNLAGKILLPFSSHCGGVPGNMQRDVGRLCPKSDVREVLSIINDGGDSLSGRVRLWMEKNKIDL